LRGGADRERKTGTVGLSAMVDDETPLSNTLQAAHIRAPVTDVACALGRTRMQVHRWKKRFGIDPEAYRGA
jgi:hypothetical protein